MPLHVYIIIASFNNRPNGLNLHRSPMNSDYEALANVICCFYIFENMYKNDVIYKIVFRLPTIIIEIFFFF